MDSYYKKKEEGVIHCYGGEQRLERESNRLERASHRVQAPPPQRYYGRNDDMLRSEYERYKRGSPRRSSGSGNGRHSTGGMSSRLEYQSPPTARHHTSHHSPGPVEPPLSPLSIPTVVGGPTPQYEGNNRDIEVISPQNTEAAVSSYERENHPPSNGYRNDYHHQYHQQPSSPYHHEVRRQEKYIPSQVSVVKRNQQEHYVEKRDDSSTIYTPATLPSTAYTPSPPQNHHQQQSRYQQQYRGGTTSTNQEIQSRHSSPHYTSHNHHPNNDLRVDVVPSSQSHPTQHYTPRGRPPPHNNSQSIAVATNSSKRQLNAEVERKKSQARYQILKEISAATNMRNTSLNDKDVNFWDRQIYTLNESFKKL